MYLAIGIIFLVCRLAYEKFIEPSVNEKKYQEYLKDRKERIGV